MPKVMIVDEVAQRGEALQSALASSRYTVIAYVRSMRELHRQAGIVEPDVIIIAVDSPDRDTLENLRVMSRDKPRPVVMFTRDGDIGKIRAAVEAGVNAYVVDGMPAQRIGPIIEVAVARFEQFQTLKRELDETETKLSERKVIERAKGILMRSRNLSEADAYRALRRQAMDTNARLADVAQHVIAVADLLA